MIAIRQMMTTGMATEKKEKKKNGTKTRRKKKNGSRIVRKNKDLISPDSTGKLRLTHRAHDTRGVRAQWGAMSQLGAAAAGALYE
jgi:hypothetical protein